LAQSSQIIRVTTGNIATVNDSQPGGASQDGLGRCPAQLGAIIELDERTAQAMSSSLHAGKYKYVQFKSGSSNLNAAGQIVEFANATDEKAHIVSPDPTTAGLSRAAGVTLNAVSKGNYGFIQVAGLATCLCKATVTTTTDGTIAVYVSDTVGAVDSLADATTATDLQIKSTIGTFAEAPANGGSKLVNLRDLSRV